jgi:hypothetical protein
VSDHLHFAVYGAIIALLLSYPVSAWVFFDSGVYTSLTLAVVTGLFLMALIIPCCIWWTYRKHAETDTNDAKVSLREWASGEFQVWQDKRAAKDAALEIIFPIAAVAIGIMAIGLVSHLTTTFGST